jgi:hypothetical protein
MTRTIPLLAALVAAAFTAPVATAQTKASTPPGATPTQRDLAAGAAAAGSAPVPRAQVKAETNAKGAAGVVTDTTPKHDLVDAKAPAAARGDVKADAQAAEKAGETVRGEAAVSKRHPRGGAAATTQGESLGATSASRAQVRAEAKDAAHGGELPKGEADVKIKP